jgi:YidC/Oxa1 family membrane protein insertase
LGSHFTVIDFNLFGLDLSAVPTLSFTVLALIPILCYLTNVFSSFLSFRMNKAMQQTQMNGGMNSTFMVLFLPLMTAWFSLSVPAAVGFYWIATNIFMIIQVVILQKFFGLDKLAEKAQFNSEKRKQALLDGTAKPSRMAELTRRALESQNQYAQQKSGVVTVPENTESNSDEVDSDVAAENVIKTNAKGKKSRSQLKDEQRRRLSKSRSKNSKK